MAHPIAYRKVIVTTLAAWALPLVALAQKAPVKTWKDPAAYGMEPAIRGTVPSIINGLISRVLPLVGAAFLVTFVYAGFMWLTAGGNDKQVTSAKATLVNSVIGMTVVSMAYFIVSFFLGVTAL